jgi:hypothetical protein
VVGCGEAQPLICGGPIGDRPTYIPAQGDDGDGGDGKRAAVMQYVMRDAQPEEVAAFVASTHPSVVSALRQTVSNMVGSLPPQQFAVTIDTVRDCGVRALQHSLILGHGLILGVHAAMHTRRLQTLWRR